jgi:Tol biopolymer transport system component
MPLNPGTKLGPYEIVAPLGAGGMGEVYRARDTRLERTVAIKILPTQVSTDPVRRQRFEREAKTISSLNHPNICTLHDIGSQDGVDYLVMECVEGETLAKRLEKGPLPLEQVLKYGAQIAEALDKAHRAGLVHRDLKPGNIMLTASGAKLLDFGLAKPTAALVSGMTLTAAATPTTPVTQEGTIVGTFQYMSPEQVEGKELDGRSDIFSLGAVLYEMLTGRKAFGGKSQLSVASAILEKEPESITAIKPMTPRVFDQIIRRCLSKDPEERWQTAQDLKLAWELGTLPQGSPRARNTSRLPWIVATASAILALVAFWLALRQPHMEERPLQFNIDPPPGCEFLLGAAGGNAISPDGRTLVFVAASSGSPKLWARPLGSTVARELPGTEGAHFPFWAPDSQSVGFFANGKLERLDLAVGTTLTLADAPNGRGAAWNSNGIIIFAPSASSGLFKVAASGGTATSLTALDSARGDSSHRWPVFLEGGQRFLHLIRSNKPHSTGIYLSSLNRPQEQTQVLETLTAAVYSPARAKRFEYLYWVRQQSLLAQPFDSKRAQFSGDAVTVPGAHIVALTPAFGRSSVSVSDDATVFLGTGSDRYQLTWFDREGKRLSTVGQADRYASLRFSPDEKRIALALGDSAGNPDFWLLDLSRAISSRLTFGGAFGAGAWSPDGQRLAYHRVNAKELLARSTNGAGEEETVFQGPSTVYVNDWSPDGGYLVYTQVSPEGRSELWLLSLNGDHKSTPFLKTSFDEMQGQVAPDSRWMAYTSNESGRSEVYVQSFPSGGIRWLVSNAGGTLPHWRRDEKELFYRSLDGKLMVASVRNAAHGLEFGAPTALFHVSEPQGMFSYPYDVTSDGQRILALVPVQVPGDTASLTVLVNWDAKP